MAFDSLFEFEQAFVGDLDLIPMAVRYKLDISGIKLSLHQWRIFTKQERRALFRQRCETATEIEQYRETLKALIANRTGEIATPLPIDTVPAWADGTKLPDQIIAAATRLGITPPTAAQWNCLSIFQRFALLKLSRAGRDHEYFAPALQEFKITLNPKTDMTN